MTAKIVLQCLAAERSLGRELSTGCCCGKSSSRRENMKFCSSQKKAVARYEWDHVTPLKSRRSENCGSSFNHKLSWTFMNFHELSWTFMNFHELSWILVKLRDLVWTFVKVMKIMKIMKLCSLRAIAMQWSTGVMRLSLVKSWSLKSFYVGGCGSKLGHEPFFLTA